MDDRGNSKEVQVLPCTSPHKQTPNPGSGEGPRVRLCPSDKAAVAAQPPAWDTQTVRAASGKLRKESKATQSR